MIFFLTAFTIQQNVLVVTNRH